MRKPEFFAAVYLILENEKGEILFLKRQNTGFMDGKLGLPAGHLEGEETLKQGIIREAKEEIGIDLVEENIELVHSSHRISNGERVYFDFYFKAQGYAGILKNTEPEKCSELLFLDKTNTDVIPYLSSILQKIENGEKFSDIETSL